MRKPASRGDTGLSNAFRQVSEERFTSTAPALQARALSHRFGLPPATAAVLAELAFPQIDSWRVRA